MELIQLKQDVFFIKAGTNVGIVRTQSGDALLVDSGLDSTVGRRVARLLSSAGLMPRWILNTHSHADHIGANRFLQEEYGCEVLTSPSEAPWVEHSQLESFALFGYADPPQRMRTKFLFAEPSTVSRHVSPPKVEVGGTDLTLVDLAGHSPGQIGVMYEGVLFCGDAVFSPQLVERHPVLFHSSISKALTVLEGLRQIDADILIVPGHGNCFGPGYSAFKEALERNIEALEQVQQFILDLLQSRTSEGFSTGVPTEQIVAEVCDRFSCKPESIGDYCLIRAAVCAHLSHLEQRNAVRPVVYNHKLCWKAE